MRHLVLAAIRAYQRYVSPYKGFCCAYRRHTGKASCSALGYRAVRRRGAIGGLVLLQRRTQRCGAVHRRHHPAGRRPLAAQRGDCDLPCDLPGDCDLPGGRAASRLCDLASCCDCCDCDWPRREKKPPDSKRPARKPPASMPPKPSRAPPNAGSTIPSRR